MTSGQALELMEDVSSGATATNLQPNDGLERGAGESDPRWARITAIRSRLASGTYRVDSTTLAEILLESDALKDSE